MNLKYTHFIFLDAFTHLFLKHSSQLLLKQLSPFTSGEASSFGGVALGRAVGGGISSLQMADAMIGRAGATARDLAPNGRSVGLSSPLPGDGASRSSQEILSLPPDASSTLYVEGLPPDCTKREVARILFAAAMLKIYNIFHLILLLHRDSDKVVCIP